MVARVAWVFPIITLVRRLSVNVVREQEAIPPPPQCATAKYSGETTIAQCVINPFNAVCGLTDFPEAVLNRCRNESNAWNERCDDFANVDMDTLVLEARGYACVENLGGILFEERCDGLDDGFGGTTDSARASHCLTGDNLFNNSPTRL